jgi:hypothetical protein
MTGFGTLWVLWLHKSLIQGRWCKVDLRIYDRGL